MQIDVWALTKSASLALAEDVRLALDGFYGIAGGLQIDAAQIEDEDSDFEAGIGPNGSGVYRQRLDFSVSHPE
jgi:hypothetical protein